MLRLLGSLVSVTLGFALLGYGFILWRAQDASIVDPSAAGSSADPALLEVLRGDAASAATSWWLLVMLAVAVCAAAWLVLALRRRPQTPAQARSGGVAWWALLVLALVAALAAGYTVYVNDLVSSGWRLALVVGGTLVVPVAYWLITAVGVQNEMAPSVPFATALRR